jgi:hypothetical protein
MKLSQVKQALQGLSELHFILENGTMVPNYFHVTEVGQITRNFIDCGGTVRSEKVVNFQLWSTETDINHRLHPEKLTSIITLSENILHIEDAEVEVEYQGETIGKYGLSFENDHFILTNLKTACLASDQCGIPAEKPKMILSEIGKSDNSNSCTPGGGCC